jgi:hypothetical protein
MAEILYYVVRLEVLSWKIAKHGLSSILKNIVRLEKDEPMAGTVHPQQHLRKWGRPRD